MNPYQVIIDNTSNFNHTLPEHYREIFVSGQLVITQPYRSAKSKVQAHCVSCEFQFDCIAIRKYQWMVDNPGRSGCPSCISTHREQQYSDTKQQILDQLLVRGITPTEPWDKRYNHGTRNTEWYNSNCGHTFRAWTSHVINAGTECTVCGKQATQLATKKSARARMLAKHATKPAREVYYRLVKLFTEQNYRKHKNVVNPDNLVRVSSNSKGIEGYHLDHIIPIRWCFENGVPPEVCGDVTNLQMLTWQENIKKTDALDITTANPPEILAQYVANPKILTLEQLQDLYGHKFRPGRRPGSFSKVMSTRSKHSTSESFVPLDEEEERYELAYLRGDHPLGPRFRFRWQCAHNHPPFSRTLLEFKRAPNCPTCNKVNNKENAKNEHCPSE